VVKNEGMVACLLAEQAGLYVIKVIQQEEFHRPSTSINSDWLKSNVILSFPENGNPIPKLKFIFPLLPTCR